MCQENLKQQNKIQCYDRHSTIQVLTYACKLCKETALDADLLQLYSTQGTILIIGNNQ